MRRSLNEIACENYRSVIVLDISSTAIEVAGKHAGELARQVTWLVGAAHYRGFSPRKAKGATIGLFHVTC